MDRKPVIKRIKTALQKRSGKAWSVTGGKGTAWGWLTIDAPPKRQTSRYLVLPGMSGDYPEHYEKTRTDTSEPGGYITEADGLELAELLGWPDGEGKGVHCQGVSIPASGDYWKEYIDRAEGRKPRKVGTIYWD